MRRPAPEKFSQNGEGRLVALALLIGAATTLAACDKHEPRTRQAATLDKPRLVDTIELPAGDGRVHVLAIPTGYLESTRCVVAVTPGSSPSVACTPKDLDIPADDAR